MSAKGDSMTRTEVEYLPERRGLARLIQRRPVIAFCVLLAAASWPVQIVVPGSLLLSLVGPSVCAFVVVAIANGRAGAGQLWRRVLRWQVGVGYYLFAVIGLGVYLLVVTYSVGTALFPDQIATPTAALAVSIAVNLVLQFVLVGLAEEFGWRGFLLPRFQRRYGPMRAALVVGALWWVWHLPLRVVSGDSSMRLAWFAVGVLAASVVYAWLFNSAGGSVLLVALLHAGENSWTGVPFQTLFRVSPQDFDVLSAASQIAYVVLALVIVTATRLVLAQWRNRVDGLQPAEAS
ncbi:CPBP family intramembrane glutamic endopeptidase [Pseudonocardia endophytica]|uniref:CAAX prenyl protease-like protein n=1 Tax=Pseudonocardia endophytica TaxID=401976 RepID=A0A4R1HYJ6_PSEEN|nr:CPBP family intramembrane glutamic endopeptidase [Pseudonocardia endophytica]TCK26611.1 CAAX prenyl protease-like protein [Pseudonocardia endophytica]